MRNSLTNIKSNLGTPPTDVVERPMVDHQFVRVEGKTALQQLQFVCSFTAKEFGYYYQVMWYIEDTPVVIKDAVKKESIRNTDLGYNDKDRTKEYQKLGINVSYNTSKCSLLCVSFQQQIQLYLVFCFLLLIIIYNIENAGMRIPPPP